jgi:hypothetical protein
MKERHKTTKSPMSPTFNAEWSGVSGAPHCEFGCSCPNCGEPLHLEGVDTHYCPVCDDFKEAYKGCPGNPEQYEEKQVTIEYFHMRLTYAEGKLLADKIVNQGIDARLTAFTRSKFEWAHSTLNPYEERVPATKIAPGATVFATFLYCEIHPDEMEVLIRRLVEHVDWDDWEWDTEAENYPLEDLLDDIILRQYGYDNNGNYYPES